VTHLRQIMREGGTAASQLLRVNHPRLHSNRRALLPTLSPFSGSTRSRTYSPVSGSHVPRGEAGSPYGDPEAGMIGRVTRKRNLRFTVLQELFAQLRRNKDSVLNGSPHPHGQGYFRTQQWCRNEQRHRKKRRFASWAMQSNARQPGMSSPLPRHDFTDCTGLLEVIRRSRMGHGIP
jgi:hypothetical protein